MMAAVKEQYQVKIPNRFSALKNLDDNVVDKSRATECIRENVKVSSTDRLGHYEFQQHETWSISAQNY
jgi:hypothetical protein